MILPKVKSVQTITSEKAKILAYDICQRGLVKIRSFAHQKLPIHVIAMAMHRWTIIDRFNL